ncbi:MAG: flagellar export protein FliJ [Panacagrimonas sp.]
MPAPSASQRLQPLQTLAGVREDAAARQFAEAQREVKARESRLQELRSYLRDYTAAAPPTAPAMLANRHAFLQKLREAERFACDAVDQAVAMAEAQRLKYLVQQRDAGVLDQLAACYREREERVFERRDQSQLDELATRRFLENVRVAAS